MMVTERLDVKEFEQINHPHPEHQGATAQTILQLAAVAMRFSHVERAPRYDDGRRENDAEHSFMLSLVATELAQELYPHLDSGLIAQFSTVHDLPELITKDIPTFKISPEALRRKEADEKAILPGLLATLPKHTRHLLERYERQDTLEAKYVRALDKLLPVATDICGDGKKVMHEDYGIDSLAELKTCNHEVHQRIQQRFGEFPELILADELLRELFEYEFITEQLVG